VNKLAVAAVAATVWACAASGADAPPGAGPAIPITELIERVAKKTGRQFVVDPRVRGDVPLAGLDVERVDYARLLAILNVNAFAAVQGKGFVSIVPDANSRQLPTRTHAGLDFKAEDDEIVTVLLVAKNLCVAQAVPILRPLLPQAAHMAAFSQADTLIINDHAANVRRVGEIFERLDRAAPAGQKCTTPPGS
jgi:general secretion pathway protein D